VPKLYLPTLTKIRYLSALGVLISHSTQLFFVGQYQNAVINFILKICVALAGPSMAAFFVLSGYVIYFSYQNGNKGFNKANTVRFFVNRIIRLYPLWVLVLALDFFVYSRSNFSTESFLNSLPFFLTMTQSWFYQASDSSSLVYSLGMGSTVGWSISVEWFFYLCFPFLLFVYSRITNYKLQVLNLAITCILYAVVTVKINNQAFNENSYLYTIANNEFSPTSQLSNWQDSFGRWLVYMNPFLWIFSFILGVLFARLVLTKHKPGDNLQKLRTYRILSLFILAFLTINSNVYVFFDSLLVFRFGAIYGLPIALILYISCLKDLSTNRLVDSKSNRLFNFFEVLGNSSYAIYLIHLPILLLFKDWRDPLLASGTFGIGYEFLRWFLVLLGIHLFAVSITHYFDAPIRRFLKRILLKS
jgi:peptidoglycan/LPS O-acetylase OafA/YrhL